MDRPLFGLLDGILLGIPVRLFSIIQPFTFPRDRPLSVDWTVHFPRRTVRFPLRPYSFALTLKIAVSPDGPDGLAQTLFDIFSWRESGDTDDIGVGEFGDGHDDIGDKFIS